MVYLGAAGVGKTYFCAALIPWIYGKISSFRYWNERDLFSSVRQAMEMPGGDYLSYVNYITDDEFLIIDDVGSSGFNQWRTEVIFEIIDKRYQSKKPTVFTSNLTRSELNSGIGQRGSSRLFAAENLIIENFNGEDLRKKMVF